MRHRITRALARDEKWTIPSAVRKGKGVESLLFFCTFYPQRGQGKNGQAAAGQGVASFSIALRAPELREKADNAAEIASPLHSCAVEISKFAVVAAAEKCCGANRLGRACGWPYTCSDTRTSKAHLLSCTTARLKHVLVLNVCVHHSEPVHLVDACPPLASTCESTTPCRPAAQEPFTLCSKRLAASLHCKCVPLNLFRSEMRRQTPFPLFPRLASLLVGEMGEPSNGILNLI